MRTLASAAAIPATLALLLAVAERTSAQTGCQTALEKWAQASRTQVRAGQDAGERGGCLPSEGARQSLLGALARARELCGDASDATLLPTRTLIDINRSFITSLSVCRTQSADAADEGWSIKTAPSPA